MKDRTQGPRHDSSLHLLHGPDRTRPVTAAEISLACELFDTRIVIEPAIAARAAERTIAPEQLRALYAFQWRRPGGSEDAPASRFLANAEFHLLLAKACDNGVLTAIVGDVFARLEPLYELAVDRGARFEDDVHAELLHAVIGGDAERAWEAAREHVAASRRIVLDALVGRLPSLSGPGGEPGAPSSE